jgi:neopullulanase
MHAAMGLWQCVMRGSFLVSWMLLLGFGCKSTDAAGGLDQAVRSCSTALSYAVEGGDTHSVYVAGDFNDWSTSTHRMKPLESAGNYGIELDLAAGNYGYQLVVDGKAQVDGHTPYRQWRNGEEVSRLIVGDCQQPALELVNAESKWDAKKGTGTLDLEFRFVAGNDGVGPEPTSFRFTLNGVTVGEPRFEENSWRFQLTLDSLPAGRHAFTATLTDQAGREAGPLKSYRWVEEAAFSWADSVIYFALTDRFSNGDKSNDAPVAGVSEQVNYGGGDFAGIRLALEDGYFDKLGINVLWISPVQANPDAAFTGDYGHLTTGYHGYWPSEARETQKRFGSLSELRLLVEAAHQRGIRVIGDLVLNHLHRDHPYYTQHKDDDWFHGDGSCVCESCGWEEHKLDCWFTGYLPDLNFEEGEVVDQMVADALWWAEQVGFDGYRVDAAKHMRKVVISTLAARLEEGPELAGEAFLLMGETFAGENDHDEISEFIGPYLLDGQFDFPLYWATADVLLRNGRGFTSLDERLAASEKNYVDPSLMATFIGNHDLPRAISHANGDISDLWGSEAKTQAWNAPPSTPASDEPFERLKLAYSFLMTTPGIPTIYYGDEIGMPGAGDPDCRRMMRFGEALSSAESSVLSHVRQLGKLRRANPALSGGKRLKLFAETDVYVYARYDADSVVVVGLNRGGDVWQGDVHLPSVLAFENGVTLQDALSDSRLIVEEGKIKMALNPRASAIFLKTVQP